jgi:hypothetical protein
MAIWTLDEGRRATKVLQRNGLRHRCEYGGADLEWISSRILCAGCGGMLALYIPLCTGITRYYEVRRSCNTLKCERDAAGGCGAGSILITGLCSLPPSSVPFTADARVRDEDDLADS